MSEPKVRFEVYRKLQKENKALKEKHITECCTEWKQESLNEISALKQSRDELLKFVKSFVRWERTDEEIHNVIQRAEILKEKE